MKAERESIKPRLLTIKEAATYLGRSVPAIRELIWKGDLPVVRPDRRIHLDILDLDKWIEKNKTRFSY
jgi:excisionase family DNA binding protein